MFSRVVITYARHRYHHKIQDGGQKTSIHRKYLQLCRKLRYMYDSNGHTNDSEVWKDGPNRWNRVDISIIGKGIRTSGVLAAILNFLLL